MNKKLRVWWIPQVGFGIDSFKVEVPDLKSAALILNTLANYDLYQLENNIKPDYASAGGLEVWNESDEYWEEWFDEETGMGFDEYCREILEGENNRLPI